MGTVQQRIEKRAKAELRGTSQYNLEVCLERYNKGLLIFQKELLEYLANQYQTTTATVDIREGQSDYSLPFGLSLGINSDFYSIAQLRVAYGEDSQGNPKYRIVKPISIQDYNIRPNGRQKGAPYIFDRISKLHPKYSFITDKVGNNMESKIRIYPTPTKDVTNGLNMTFNYITEPVTLSTSEEKLLLPRYFLDVIDDYLSYRLIKAENIELAGQYYQEFITTLHNNIYGLNRDQRPVEEEFGNFRALYMN